MDRRVALVTGASRGIGEACARYLARVGFDVAITARTVHEGERRAPIRTDLSGKILDDLESALRERQGSA